LTGTAIFPTSTLDPATLPAGEVLSNGNLTVTGTSVGQYGCARGTKTQSSGKRYFEVRFDNQSNTGGLGAMAGLANSSFSFGNGIYPGYDANSWGVGSVGTGANQEIFSSSAQGTAGVPTSGDVAMVAVDFSSGYIWFGVNNTWFNGSGPVGGGDYVFTSGTALWPVVFVYEYSSTAPGLAATFNSGGSAFKYTVPSGFVAWG
jgi:hypothetical protein